MALAEELLPKVKQNLILEHDADDELLLGLIHAALDYAKSYQKRHRLGNTIPPTTERAVIMLASHLYESRDGSTAGFWGDRPDAANAVWQTVNRLLAMEKRWQV